MSASVILALDQERVPNWILDAAPYVAGFKVGLQLFCSLGPAALEHIPAGKPVFLDLKLYDIPNTMVQAVTALRFYPNIRWITVHTAAGEEGLRRVRRAVIECFPQAEIVAVARLTSDLGALNPERFTWMINDELEMARQAGIRSAILPPACLFHFRGPLRGNLWTDFTFFCPGIRTEQKKDDHIDTLSPKEAVKAGADFLVIGRPVFQAQDPVKALKYIVEGVV